MWVWEHALFNYNPKRPDSTKKDKTVEVITKADHDAALRRAKAEVWREAATHVLTCMRARDAANDFDDRAAQIEEVE